MQSIPFTATKFTHFSLGINYANIYFWNIAQTTLEQFRYITWITKPQITWKHETPNLMNDLLNNYNEIQPQTRFWFGKRKHFHWIFFNDTFKEKQIRSRKKLAKILIKRKDRKIIEVCLEIVIDRNGISVIRNIQLEKWLWLISNKISPIKCKHLVFDEKSSLWTE